MDAQLTCRKSSKFIYRQHSIDFVTDQPERRNYLAESGALLALSCGEQAEI